MLYIMKVCGYFSKLQVSWQWQVQLFLGDGVEVVVFFGVGQDGVDFVLQFFFIFVQVDEVR